LGPASSTGSGPSTLCALLLSNCGISELASSAPFHQTPPKLPEQGWADQLLSVDLHGPIANTHFFTETEIEFDLDPGEVASQRELDAVLQFMHLLANATGRETILTPENQEDIAIFRVRRNEARVEYMPFGGYK